MALQRERILILAKTYPSPSANYIETSCVAGINSAGEMRRLFPVPFRLLEDDQQFSKWQWIDANIEKARNDHRPESFRIDVGTLECQEKILPKNAWEARREWIGRLPQFESFSALKRWSSETKASLALIRPRQLNALDIVPARRADWSEEEISKLMRAQNQASLLTEPETQGEIAMLNKLPCNFYYRYVCSDGIERRHKIVDWEAGQLYRRCARDYGLECDDMFRQKLLDSMLSKDMMLLMGNQHRFQDQWLIISLIYPPRQTPTNHSMRCSNRLRHAYMLHVGPGHGRHSARHHRPMAVIVIGLKAKKRTIVTGRQSCERSYFCLLGSQMAEKPFFIYGPVPILAILISDVFRTSQARDVSVLKPGKIQGCSQRGFGEARLPGKGHLSDVYHRFYVVVPKKRHKAR